MPKLTPAQQAKKTLKHAAITLGLGAAFVITCLGLIEDDDFDMGKDGLYWLQTQLSLSHDLVGDLEAGAIIAGAAAVGEGALEGLGRLARGGYYQLNFWWNGPTKGEMRLMPVDADKRTIYELLQKIEDSVDVALTALQQEQLGTARHMIKEAETTLVDFKKRYYDFYHYKFNDNPNADLTGLLQELKDYFPAWSSCSNCLVIGKARKMDEAKAIELRGVIPEIREDMKAQIGEPPKNYGATDSETGPTIKITGPEAV